MKDSRPFPADSTVVRSGVHAIVLTFSRVIAVCLGFALHLVLGRNLGVADYGLYALGRSVLDVCSVLAKFGFENTLVRFVPRRRVQEGAAAVQRVIATAFAVLVVLGLALAALVFALGPLLGESVFSEPGLSGVVRGFALCIIPFALLGVAGAALRGQGRIRAFAAIHDLCFPALHLLLVVLAFVLGLGLLGAVGAALVASLVCALAMVGHLYRTAELRARRPAEGPRFDTAVLSFAVTLLAGNFAGAAMMPATRILLGILDSPAQVGLFNAAAVIAAQTSLVLGGANKAFAPIVAELHAAQDRDDLALAYKRMTKWVGAATMPVCLVMALYAEQLLGLFGEDFSPAGNLLVVLVAGQFFNAATGSVGVVLNMTGRHRVEFYNRWAMIALALVMSIVLIPAHGAMGAAIATTAAVVTINLARVIEVYLLERIQPFSRTLTRAFMVGAAVSVTAFLAVNRPEFQMLWWPFQALLIVAVYVVAVCASCLDPEDRQVASRVLASIRRRRGAGARPPQV